MMFGWIGVHSLASLFVFAAIYGCGSAGIQSIWPAVINGLMEVPDLKRAGVRMGMAFTVVSWACLTGP
jgi:MFS family permease